MAEITLVRGDTLKLTLTDIRLSDGYVGINVVDFYAAYKIYLGG